jgi:hypothetical protein
MKNRIQTPKKGRRKKSLIVGTYEKSLKHEMKYFKQEKIEALT